MKKALVIFSDTGTEDQFVCMLELPKQIEDLPEAVDSVMDKLRSQEFIEAIVEEDGRELDFPEPYRIKSCIYEGGTLFFRVEHKDGISSVEKLVDFIRMM